MTEAEWLAATDPWPMLEFLRTSGRASKRQFRLLACACVRRVWHLLRDERSRGVVEAAETCADGQSSEEQVNAAGASAWLAAREYLILKCNGPEVLAAAARTAWLPDADFLVLYGNRPRPRLLGRGPDPRQGV